MTVTDYLIEFDKLEWIQAMPGARYKAFISDEQKVRLIEFTEELFEKDWCQKGHIGYILEGQMTIDFSGKVVEFSAGDGLFIPPGEKHKHKASVAKGEKVLFVSVEKA